MIRPMTLNDVSEITCIYAHYVNNTVVTFDTKVPSETEMRERLLPIIGNCPAWVCVEEGKIAGYCYAYEWKTKKAYSSTAERIRKNINGATDRRLPQTLLPCTDRLYHYPQRAECNTP